MLFTEEDYKNVKRNHLFADSNAAWNESKINSPSRVGYLMEKIRLAHPESLEEWETYFLKNIKSEKCLKRFAGEFKTFLSQKYKRENILLYVCCRLIYETYLGYISERETVKNLYKLLKNAGYDIKQYALSGEYDNKYAVDTIIRVNGKLICGIQIKPESYVKSTRPKVVETRKLNRKKNYQFTKRYGVPVIYAIYTRKNWILNKREILDVFSKMYAKICVSNIYV